MLVEGWHKLQAWPALHKRYILSPLTIFSISLVVNSSRYTGLVWDAIISCEFLDVYDAAPRLLRLKPEEILMVAAHNFDLLAAQTT